jgi:hypothetical protein
VCGPVETLRRKLTYLKLTVRNLADQGSNLSLTHQRRPVCSQKRVRPKETVACWFCRAHKKGAPPANFPDPMSAPCGLALIVE